MSKELNEHLGCVLSSHSIEKEEELINKYRVKKSELKEAISSHFSGEIFSPFDSGSYKKHTAINTKFDLDICIPFKKKYTLEENFNSINDFLNNTYEDETLLEVKKQKVSIGVKFQFGYDILEFDVVPGREISNFEVDHDLNLFVNQHMGSFEEKSHIKTNIHKQIDHIYNFPDARPIIKLLKVWRGQTGITNFKSFLIELITIRAFQNNASNIPKDLWGKLKLVLEFIRDNIVSIKLVDPGNSNNIVSDALEDYQKESLSYTISTLLESVENDNTRIEAYFPINKKYPCNQKNTSPYIITDRNKPDRIPNNDFGV